MEYAQYMQYVTSTEIYQATAYLRLLAGKVQIRVGDAWIDTEIPVRKIDLLAEAREACKGDS